MIFNFCGTEDIHNTNPQILGAILFCFVLDFFMEKSQHLAKNKSLIF